MVLDFLDWLAAYKPGERVCIKSFLNTESSYKKKYGLKHLI